MTQKPHFSLLATSFPGGPAPRKAAFILGGLWLILFFGALFSPSLLDDADATHANAARAMATTADLVTLKVNGVRYLEKAPLPYWLSAASFKIFGFNTFAAHLPQAFAVLLLVLLGHRWANQAFGSRTGFYTAIGLLTSAGVFLFTRILIPEVLLSLLLATALLAFLKTLTPQLSVEETNSVPHFRPHNIGPKMGLGGATRFPPSTHETVILSEARSAQSKDPDTFNTTNTTRPSPPTSSVAHSSQPHRDDWVDPALQTHVEHPSFIPSAPPSFYPYVMWTALALAVLTKGLVALVFFFGTTLLYLLLIGELRQSLPKLKLFTGFLLFLAIAAPWHILAGLRNTGGLDGHGFFWFYFWNEHVLRFLGKRIPRDYNKLPGYLFWTLHLVWLFPWSLFLPLGVIALWRRLRHQSITITRNSNLLPPLRVQFVLIALLVATQIFGKSVSTTLVVGVIAFAILLVAEHRRAAGFHPSPFHRIDPQQRTILLLSLFAALILLFFSLSTNQEYYTFPAYLPLLLLIAATITRAEQTYSADPAARRWINFAHAALTLLGAGIAVALFWGLWSSRHLPFVPDIGDLLAHRGVGDYTLSMSHLFDLTGPSFAALRLPALLAALAFALGPAFAWMLRMQRRHLAATTSIAFTAAAFLFAAHVALARFGPMLSSEDLAAKIQELQDDRRISRDSNILLYGDQAYGSSIPFYLGEQVDLVNARSSSMLFGSTFPDCPPIFLTDEELIEDWGQGQRKILFIPLEKRDEVDKLLGNRQIMIEETSGKALVTDRPLDQ